MKRKTDIASKEEMGPLVRADARREADRKAALYDWLRMNYTAVRTHGFSISAGDSENEDDAEADAQRLDEMIERSMP